MMRNILLHCHFFKNAGTTIDWALKRSFPDKYYEHKGELSISDWNICLVRAVDNPSVEVVLSHIFTFTPPKISGINFNLITMLRHPIERITSVAAFDRKREYRNSVGIIKNKYISIRDYVKAYLRDGTPASIRNMHTLRFANCDRGTPPATKKDFNTAVKISRRYKCIGLVEAFDESMVLLEEYLQPIFPTLDLAYVPQNVNQKSQSIDQRIGTLREQLGEELFAILLNKNSYDIQFYKIMKKQFYKKIAKIDRFSEKLHDFKIRCLLATSVQQKE